ncbi:MAG: hypothetical protein AB8G15_11380 [Saprospiraceae bacterium]
MSDPKCLANIIRKPAPYNIPCTQSFCQKTRESLREDCDRRGLSRNTPALTYDPELGSSCYCCCFGVISTGIPIAVIKKEFVLSQDIKPMDKILTTGLDLNWRPGKVAAISTAIDASMVPGLYLLEYQMEGEQPTRELLVPVDHLVLSKDKQLKKVQALTVGEELLTAAGAIAKVVFIELGVFETSIQHIELEGAFDGENLDGHLLDTNGIISADFKVQAYYASQEE